MIMKLRDIAKIVNCYGYIYFNLDDFDVLDLDSDVYEKIITNRKDDCTFYPDTPEYNNFMNYLTESKYKRFLKLLDCSVINIETCYGECGEDGDCIINLTAKDIPENNYKTEI